MRKQFAQMIIHDKETPRYIRLRIGLRRTLGANGLTYPFVLSVLSSLRDKMYRSMKSLELIIFIFLCTTLSHLDAKNLLTSTERIRKKVDSIMTEKTSNFKEVLARAGIAGNVVSGHCLLQGKQPGDASPKEMTLTDIEKALDALYWSTQKQFIDALSASTKQSEVQAMLLLKHKVKEKYGAAKTPLLIFAQDLATEEQQLKDLLTTLLRVSNTSKMSARDKTNHISLLKKLYDQRQQQAHNLENLIQTTNALLM